MVQFIKKYRHGLIILAYAIVYMLFFEYLECRPVWGFHVIDTVLMITYHFVSILLSPIYYGFRIRFSQFYTLSSGTRIKKNIIS